MRGGDYRQSQDLMYRMAFNAKALEYERKRDSAKKGSKVKGYIAIALCILFIAAVVCCFVFIN